MSAHRRWTSLFFSYNTNARTRRQKYKTNERIKKRRREARKRKTKEISSRSPSRASSVSCNPGRTSEKDGERRSNESQTTRCSPTREGVYQGVCRARRNEEFALHETAIPVQGGIYRLCNSERIADVKPSRAHLSHTPAPTPRVRAYLHRGWQLACSLRAAFVNPSANLQTGSGIEEALTWLASNRRRTSKRSSIVKFRKSL